jgi:hypothetical protein
MVIVEAGAVGNMKETYSPLERPETGSRK